MSELHDNASSIFLSPLTCKWRRHLWTAPRTTTTQYSVLYSKGFDEQLSCLVTNTAISNSTNSKAANEHRRLDSTEPQDDTATKTPGRRYLKKPDHAGNKQTHSTVYTEHYFI